MGDKKTYIAKQLVKYAQKLDQKGFCANHDGNISARFSDVILATPTAVSKGDIFEEIIITLDASGKQIAGVGKPFSEIRLHLAAYGARPETRAVIHAHPPFATARGLLGKPIYPAIPEAIVSLGKVIPVADFAMPGDANNEVIITRILSYADALMLPGNGVIAIGDSVEQAYLRLELVEHLAKIYYYAESAGQQMLVLTEGNIDQLLAKRASLGLGPQPQIGQADSNNPCVVGTEKPVAVDNTVMANKNKAVDDHVIYCSQRGSQSVAQIDSKSIDMVKSLIAEEIKKIVSNKNE